MMNRRGFLRIVEASISIVILIGVLFFLFLQTRPEAVSPSYDEFLRDLLKEISQNESLRVYVLENSDSSKEKINGFLENRIPTGAFEYDFTICNIGQACGLERFIDGEVYAQERVISSDVDYLEYDPKKVRLFLWQK